jgi:S-adenosylmethionine:tRNA ribosyltransferase-isomerase
MIAATRPVQRPSDARLLVADNGGHLVHTNRADFVRLLRPGDIVVANDAATMPASLLGRHLLTGQLIEVRLAGRETLRVDDVKRFAAVIFGRGDFRMRTEDRPLPPDVKPGDRLVLGPLDATVTGVLNHPRLVTIEFDGSPRQFWEGLARYGRPIQYSHVQTPLSIWDTWTPIAGPPVAFEPPSAGFVLDWNSVSAMTRRGVAFTTLTHAAGLSSTGDPHLDALLPFDEPYFIPERTAELVGRARADGGRVVAIGTTSVRALEHASAADGIVHAGYGLATQRIVSTTRLRIVDAILTGTHERGSSHYELLRAFVDDATLRTIDRELDAQNYRTHEFGDSLLLQKAAA